MELFKSTVKEQKEWDRQPLIKVSHIQHDQILIRSGEKFKANRIIREIFAQAKKELSILDAYFGSKLFELIEDSNVEARVRIVTSDKITKATISTYKDYKTQYPSAEMRVIETVPKKNGKYPLKVE